MTTSTNRYEYIDITKGIGILLVVWAHILLVGWTHRFIYAFHMPLFFFMSGYLFNRCKFHSFKDFLKKRFRRLIVPYVIYSVSTWAIWAIFRYATHSNVESYLMPLVQTVIAQGSGEFMVHNSALWFIPCLFVVEIIYYFICKMGEIATVAICIAFAIFNAIMASIFGDSYMFTLPWNLDAAFYALPFYGIANIIHKHYSHELLLAKVNQNKISAVATTVVLTAILYYLSVFFRECSMGSSSYQCEFYIFILRAFIGCFAVIIFSMLLANLQAPKFIKNSLSWCGRNSLDIMCLHIPVKGVAIILIGKALHPMTEVSESGELSAIAFIITMIVCIPMIFAINKYIRKQ